MLSQVQKLIKELRRLPEVQGIILFGSQAKGTAKPLSDIDLAVITTPLNAHQKANIQTLAPPGIDLCLFDELPLAVQYRVFKEGKVLYEKSALFLHRRRIAALRDYLDFSPIIHRHIKAVLG